MTLISDEIRALIGQRSEPLTAHAPISEDSLRRFIQAVMEDNPVHWDEEAAQESRYDAVVGTPLFPMHAFRRAPGTPDPLEALKDDPELDGIFAGRSTMGGLPPVDLPLKRLLNGGTEAEFFQLAKVGDVVTSQSEYLDITEREGRDGSPMVIVRVATTYTNQDGDVLAVITNSAIRR